MEAIKYNTGYIASVIGNLVLLVIVFMRGCGHDVPCTESIVERHWTDTIPINKEQAKHDTVNSLPILAKVLKGVDALRIRGLDTFASPRNTEGSTAAVQWICPDTNAYVYTDTINRPDNYWAAITDTVMGNSITGRSIVFANLKPVIVEHSEKTITQVQKERPRLYAGAFAGYARGYTPTALPHFSIGPALLVTIPQGMAIGYGFDARNNGHQLNVYFKIKLRK